VNFTISNISKKTFAILMIGTMGLLIVNKGLFIHSHKLEDGSIIIHAHPYDKNQDSEPFKKHHHSKAEFIFLQSLNQLFLSIYLIIPFFSFINGKISYLYIEKFRYASLFLPYQGRASPVFLNIRYIS